MKIINVSPLWFHKGDGITDVVLNQHETLKKHNISRSIIQTNVLSSKSKPISNHALYQKIDGDIYKPSGKFKFLKTIWRERNSKFILHGVFQIEMMMAMILLLFLRSSFLIVPHSSLSKKAFSSFFTLKSCYYYFFLKNIIYFSKGVVYLNNDERESSIYRGSNFYIIPNGVNIPKNKGHRSLDGEYLKFCFLGRYDIQHKGIDRLLNFLSQLLSFKPELKWKLDIYGSDTKGDREKVESLISNLGLSNHVTTHGPVYGDEKSNVLQNVDIFALTSRYEGMPISVLEALSYGKFCFLSKETNLLKELQEKSFCAEYNPKSFELSFNSLFSYLQKNYDQKNKISQMSMDYVRTEYSWDSVVSRYIKIFEGKMS